MGLPETMGLWLKTPHVGALKLGYIGLPEIVYVGLLREGPETVYKMNAGLSREGLETGNVGLVRRGPDTVQVGALGIKFVQPIIAAHITPMCRAIDKVNFSPEAILTQRKLQTMQHIYIYDNRQGSSRESLFFGLILYRCTRFLNILICFKGHSLSQAVIIFKILQRSKS